MPNTYVSLQEFIAFKHKVKERIDGRSDKEDKKLIELDKKLDNLTELMIDGFDRMYAKIGA